MPRFMLDRAQSFVLRSYTLHELRNQLFCSMHSQGQKSEQNHTTMNFVGFITSEPIKTRSNYI